MGTGGGAHHDRLLSRSRGAVLGTAQGDVLVRAVGMGGHVQLHRDRRLGLLHCISHGGVQGAHAGALPPAWGHVWGSGGPCAGLSHPSRGSFPTRHPAWPERLGSGAVRQGDAGLHPTMGARPEAERGAPGAGEGAKGQEQGSRAQGTLHGSALSDRGGRKSAETRGNKKPHTLPKPPAATGSVPQAVEEAKSQRHNEEGV